MVMGRNGMGRNGHGPIWLWAEMTSDPANVSGRFGPNQDYPGELFGSY